jgi:hypothetical protein
LRLLLQLLLQTYLNSPTDKVLLLIADHPELDWPVTHAVLVQQFHCAYDGAPAGLVVMEQVSTQQQHVDIFFNCHLQDFLKGSEGVMLAILILLPHSLRHQTALLSTLITSARELQALLPVAEGLIARPLLIPVPLLLLLPLLALLPAIQCEEHLLMLTTAVSQVHTVRVS